MDLDDPPDGVTTGRRPARRSLHRRRSTRVNSVPFGPVAGRRRAGAIHAALLVRGGFLWHHFRVTAGHISGGGPTTTRRTRGSPAPAARKRPWVAFAGISALCGRSRRPDSRARRTSTVPNSDNRQTLMGLRRAVSKESGAPEPSTTVLDASSLGRLDHWAGEGQYGTSFRRSANPALLDGRPH